MDSKLESKEKRKYVKSGNFTKEARVLRAAELATKRKEVKTELKERKRRSRDKSSKSESTIETTNTEPILVE